MKVLILLLTGEDVEPNLRQEFINGYESSGLTWDGEITLIENVSEGTITDNYLAGYYNTGYELMLRNTAPVIGKVSIYENARNAGMLFVSPVGSNSHIEVNAFNEREIIVRCGSGIPEYGNQTSYPAMFYDKNDSEGSGFAVADIRQCGQTYTLSHIRRASNTVLAFKIAGYTGDYADIGLHLSGTPVYFSGLAGSDISPLPTGVKYCNLVGDGSTQGNEFFMVEHATTAGTINTGFNLSDYQALSAGTMQFGDTDTGRALVRMNGATVFPFLPASVTFTGISGFENNVPDGVMSIYSAPNGRGYFNMVMLDHNLGTGTYEGDGRIYNVSQSYSHSYIAGKLASIKDMTGDDWNIVVGRAIKTASGGGVRDTVDGFGVISTAGAGDSLLNTDEQEGLGTPVLGEITEYLEGYIVLTWSYVPFTKKYEVYFRNELYETVTAQITTLTISDFPRYSKGRINNFKVRAVNNTSTSEFSNEREYNHYYYSGIMVEDYS